MANEKEKVKEAIANVKLALEARDDASESDDTIVGTTNRGRKLKRKARFVNEGKLDDGLGANGYKEEIEYFGTRKKIIYRKHSRRKRVAIDSEDEDCEDSENESGSESPDPYEGIDLTKLLAPLESAADLPSHPSLAHIYTSRTLNELIQQSLEKVCEEQAHTIKLKNLLTRFLGDDPWINLGKMQWPNEDHETIARDRSENLLQQFTDLRSSNGIGREVATSGAEPNGKLVNGTPKPAENGIEDEDQEMAGVNGHAGPLTSGPGNTDRDEEAQPTTQEGTVVGDDDLKELKTENINSHDEMCDATPLPEPHRMTTRSALNNAAASPAPPSEAPSVEVDPFFFPPNYTIDRDYGLPPAEAEETRRLVANAVQRQDEFMRGLKRVHEGLLRAENMRKKVWEWCRTMEGMREYHQHLTEVSGNPSATNFDIDLGEAVGLSDGEDWYDMDAWKLEEPLNKGHEEEDEGDVAPGKKTRRRGDR